MSSQKLARLSPRSRKMIDRMLRVDHAGELGANRIYQGQMAVLGRSDVGPEIQVSKKIVFSE